MGSIDDSDPGIAVFPVIPHLRLPGKIAGFVDVVYFQLSDHVSVVDIQDNQGLDCASVERGYIGPGYFYDLWQFEIQFVEIFLKALGTSFDAIFGVVGPEGHGDGEDGHSASSQHPLGSFYVGVILKSFGGHLSNTVDHDSLHHQQPLVDISVGCVCVNYWEEFDVLSFGWIHTVYLFALVEF